MAAFCKSVTAEIFVNHPPLPKINSSLKDLFKMCCFTTYFYRCFDKVHFLEFCRGSV